jgi:outer membrane protein OmpA-like peptidoglycan-associated protein
VVFVSIILITGLAAQQADNPACKDHPLFPSRMPEYRLEACKVEDFGAYDFFTTKGPKTSVEGKFTFLTYSFTGQRASEPSGLAVVRNYDNAIQKVGGVIVQTVQDRWVNGKIVKDGNEVWAQIEKGNGKIWLRIIEKKGMEQHIVADATAFSKDIKATGHVAVYGINFDTGKSTIKAESAQAIGEIAKLLKTDAVLKLGVVGHTDSAGGMESNIRLSQERADAVLQTLVRDHGIAAARLKAFGCGQFAPVASNDTEEGRAKNRRVELVKQ